MQHALISIFNLSEQSSNNRTPKPLNPLIFLVHIIIFTEQIVNIWKSITYDY